MKINVTGTSSSGKSTLSKKIAHRLNIPYIELDQLFWQPNWQGSSDDIFFAKIEAALSQPAWVLDGNYTRTTEIKWRHVDMVVWLDLPFTRTMFQAIKRALTRIITQKELWPNTGNRETMRKVFFDRHSILLWTWQTYRPNREKYLAMMANPQYAHITFVHLRSTKEIEKFLMSLDFDHNS